MIRPGLYQIANAIWEVFGDTEFTYTDVKEKVTSVEVWGPTLFGLYNLHILERVTGLKRSHQGKYPVPYWRFTQRFIHGKLREGVAR